MKKFLSLLLACLMVMSLAACGGKGDSSSGEYHNHPSGLIPDPNASSELDEQEESNEPEEPAVTAESLVESGFGVGVPKSATLYFSFMIKEGSRSRTINCTHEYDGSYDHMVVTSQVDADGTELP